MQHAPDAAGDEHARRVREVAVRLEPLGETQADAHGAVDAPERQAVRRPGAGGDVEQALALELQGGRRDDLGAGDAPARAVDDEAVGRDLDLGCAWR